MKIIAKIAGITMVDQDDLNSCNIVKGVTLDIRKEKNEYANGGIALAVYFLETKLGYIAEKINQFDISDKDHFMMNNIEEAIVREIWYKEGKELNNEGKGNICGISMEAEDGLAERKDIIPDEKPIKMKSINEDIELDFYPIAHQYWLDGKKLKSATNKVSEMFDKFDSKGMARNCANSPKWSLTEEEILDMWDNSGNAASSIGTGLHTYMENYEKYGEKGLPKMPIFKEIVLSFPWDREKYETEALITDVKNGLCGLVDRLRMKNEVCRVEDYKFNYGAKEIKSSFKCDKYPELPNNKLSKYQIQMSIYAKMLENTGNKVDDKVVAHVWDGKWNSYELDRIKDVY